MSRLGINFAGTYRKLISRPKQLSWKWLVPEITPSQPAAAVQVIATELTSDVPIKHDTNDRPPCDGPRNILELCFSLDKSCYATVLLRELMKPQ